MNKIDSMFSNEKTQGKHTPRAYTKHVHKEQHSHVDMYGKVYTCTHCGRQGHIAQYCYNRLKIKNNVWIRENINPQGPKKI